MAKPTVKEEGIVLLAKKGVTHAHMDKLSAYELGYIDTMIDSGMKVEEINQILTIIMEYDEDIRDSILNLLRRWKDRATGDVIMRWMGDGYEKVYELFDYLEGRYGCYIRQEANELCLVRG